VTCFRSTTWEAHAPALHRHGGSFRILASGIRGTRSLKLATVKNKKNTNKGNTMMSIGSSKKILAIHAGGRRLCCPLSDSGCTSEKTPNTVGARHGHTQVQIERGEIVYCLRQRPGREAGGWSCRTFSMFGQQTVPVDGGRLNVPQLKARYEVRSRLSLKPPQLITKVETVTARCGTSRRPTPYVLTIG